MAREPFAIGLETVASGERRMVSLPLSALSNRTPMALQVCVIHGKEDGPTLFVSGAVHGDELTGVAICRRLLSQASLGIKRGTLMVIPIVNAFGFIGHSRYLPDRRDLNRSFPGSARGSLAAQLAQLFLTEVVVRSQCGIDLHSAAIHRSNLPQIRVNSHDQASYELACAFGAPIIVHSGLRDGSLREAAAERGVPVLVYEAGEGLRVDDLSVSIGFDGVKRVLAHLDMIDWREGGHRAPPALSTGSKWVRAEESGLYHPYCDIGDHVTVGTRLAVVYDPYGEAQFPVDSPLQGIVIGRTNIPAVNQGDALFHIARVEDAPGLGEHYDRLQRRLESETIPDEDEII